VRTIQVAAQSASPLLGPTSPVLAARLQAIKVAPYGVQVRRQQNPVTNSVSYALSCLTHFLVLRTFLSYALSFWAQGGPSKPPSKLVKQSSAPPPLSPFFLRPDSELAHPTHCLYSHLTIARVTKSEVNGQEGLSSSQQLILRQRHWCHPATRLLKPRFLRRQPYCSATQIIRGLVPLEVHASKAQTPDVIVGLRVRFTGKTKMPAYSELSPVPRSIEPTHCIHFWGLLRLLGLKHKGWPGFWAGPPFRLLSSIQTQCPARSYSTSSQNPAEFPLHKKHRRTGQRQTFGHLLGALW
jgi:hypothetical protein